MFQNRFDEFYLTICKQVGGIEGLLKSFFDFMFRKTDFFYECDPGDKMGFPPGYSKNLLISIFQKFQQEHYKRFPKKDPIEFEKKLKKFRQQKQAKKSTNQQKNKPKQTKQISEPTKIEKKDEKLQQKPQSPKQTKKQQQKQTPKNATTAKPIINTYNGGTNQKYSWSQQSHDVEVTVQIEAGTSAKMLNVVLKTDSVSIKKKTGQTILQGQLYEKINAPESVWKIQKSANKTLLVLNLQKAQDKIWSTVFKGDPQIDTSKVNNTKPLHEFDDETQGAIRKIMYEQQRKQMGLPTTQQEKQLEALKTAWNAEGSPFKGQPFDPSKFNLQGSNFNPGA